MLISKMMKQFLIKILVFFCIILFIDILLGLAFDHMTKGAVGGNNGRINYICNETNEDILIFGSSRAAHHYNPKILMDSLGITTYNCGEDGNGIILNYGRLLMILERYRPKMIIYDISVSFDLTQDDNHKYLGKLKPYYERENIKEIFFSVDKTEQWKMMSQLYRYNSLFLSILADRYHPINSVGFQGYRPIEGKMDTMKISKAIEKPELYRLDSLKINFLNEFIDKAEGIKLVCVVSPFWYGMDTMRLAPIQEICKHRNIPFIDFSNKSKYVGNNDFFRDGSHLNARGADEFTKDLIRELKKRKLLQYNNLDSV